MRTMSPCCHWQKVSRRGDRRGRSASSPASGDPARTSPRFRRDAAIQEGRRSPIARRPTSSHDQAQAGRNTRGEAAQQAQTGPGRLRKRRGERPLPRATRWQARRARRANELGRDIGFLYHSRIRPDELALAGQIEQAGGRGSGWVMSAGSAAFDDGEFSEHPAGRRQSRRWPRCEGPPAAAARRGGESRPGMTPARFGGHDLRFDPAASDVESLPGRRRAPTPAARRSSR